MRRELRGLGARGRALLELSVGGGERRRLSRRAGRCSRWHRAPPSSTCWASPAEWTSNKADLERGYRERSLRLHPDRAGKDDPRERRLSLERTALLNEAYKTLRAPEPRAFYLLKLHGLDLLKDEARAVTVPTEVLENVLELREQLDSARTAGDDEQVGALSDRVRVLSATTLSAAQSALRRLEGAPADVTARDEAAQALARLRYHHRFLEAAEASDEEILVLRPGCADRYGGRSSRCDAQPRRSAARRPPHQGEARGAAPVRRASRLTATRHASAAHSSGAPSRVGLDRLAGLTTPRSEH